MASAYDELGRSELARQFLQRSYSYAIDSGRLPLAEKIKNNAEESFSIILESIAPIL